MERTAADSGLEPAFAPAMQAEPQRFAAIPPAPKPVLVSSTATWVLGGSCASCEFYHSRETDGCAYAKLAYVVCRSGNPACGRPESQANRCIRGCLLAEFQVDKQTPGCYEQKGGSLCPTAPCLTYNHDFCFKLCGCERPPLPI